MKVKGGKILKSGSTIKNNNIGEYAILGVNYEGQVVHNEKFPDDLNTGTSPLEWNYINVENARETWNTGSDKQISYMLSEKLSRNNTIYDITAKDIGIEKAKIENLATWKTSRKHLHTKNRLYTVGFGMRHL